ncbi:Methyltransferase-like protein 21B [Dimargaris cristalligena]|nr:Methyltransferase-like protein 21B [Dimargaris cristalligena]
MALVPWKFSNPFVDPRQQTQRDLILGPHKYLHNQRCIELGAGCGLVGLAAWLQGATVLLTDITDALPHLERNIRLNTDHLMKHTPEVVRVNPKLGRKDTPTPIPLVAESISAQTLYWDQPDTFPDEDGSFDIILGSEILYLPEFHKHLLSTFNRLSHSDTRILLTFKPRGFGEERFFRLAEHAGFKAQQVNL